MNGSLSFSSNVPQNTNYIFAGFNTFAEGKSSIISLSDGSYLVGPVLQSNVPA